jgi:hypothetical protein
MPLQGSVTMDEISNRKTCKHIKTLTSHSLDFFAYIRSIAVLRAANTAVRMWAISQYLEHGLDAH